jgi:ATP-binding cassette subfamily F protein uup
MIYLRGENLGRRFGERVLFENLDLSIAKGERVAFIAKNGSGKTSLLNILTGREEPDGGGSVMIDKNITWTYLEQEPHFNENDTVLDAIFNTNHPKFRTVAEFELLTEKMELDPENTEIHEAMQKVMEDMELYQAWDLDNKVHTILTKLNLHHHLEQFCKSFDSGTRFCYYG